MKSYFALILLCAVVLAAVYAMKPPVSGDLSEIPLQTAYVNEEGGLVYPFGAATVIKVDQGYQNELTVPVWNTLTFLNLDTIRNGDVELAILPERGIRTGSMLVVRTPFNDSTTNASRRYLKAGSGASFPNIMGMEDTTNIVSLIYNGSEFEISSLAYNY